MTENERRALASYVREVADRLGLVDWKIYLFKSKPPDSSPDAAGNCHVSYGHHTAQIWLHDGIHRETPEWQRYVVAHELLHIPLHACWEAWKLPIEKQLAPAAFEALVPGAIRTWEMTIDQLARAFARELPYIDWSATPSLDWIGKPDSDGDLPLYSSMFSATGLAPPRS